MLLGTRPIPARSPAEGGEGSKGAYRGGEWERQWMRSLVTWRRGRRNGIVKGTADKQQSLKERQQFNIITVSGAAKIALG